MNFDLDLLQIAARQHQLVRADDLLLLGIARPRFDRLVDEGRWVRLAPGTYHHAATPVTFAMRVYAGYWWLGRRGALYGSSALHWLGVDVPEPTHAEFVVERRLRSVPNWMTLHTSTRWNHLDAIGHNGVLTADATRGILDLATVRQPAFKVERAIDSAMRLQLTSVDRLRHAISTVDRGRRGVRLLRELMLDSGGHSFLERRFLALVRKGGLPRPDCQVVFKDGSRTAARVDFHFPRFNLVVEVSGRLGHSSDRDRQRDAHRRNHLQQRGQRVIEFVTSDVIDHPHQTLAVLKTSIDVAA